MPAIQEIIRARCVLLMSGKASLLERPRSAARTGSYRNHSAKPIFSRRSGILYADPRPRANRTRSPQRSCAVVLLNLLIAHLARDGSSALRAQRASKSNARHTNLVSLSARFWCMSLPRPTGAWRIALDDRHANGQRITQPHPRRLKRFAAERLTDERLLEFDPGTSSQEVVRAIGSTLNSASARFHSGRIRRHGRRCVRRLPRV